MLSRHSSGFKKMLENRQPLTVLFDPTVEGCPVIHLSDTATDVKYMLSAIFDKVKRPQLASVEYISAMLRLGKKYAVNHMVSEVAEILEDSFPTSLEKFAALGHQRHSIDYCPANLIDIANLALDAGFPSILPCCYLLLSQKLDLVFIGALRTDGSCANLNAVSKDAVIQGREKILAEASVETLSWLTLAQPSALATCTAKLSCPYAFAVVLEKLWRKRLPLETVCFMTVKSFLAQCPPICPSCQALISGVYEAGRKGTWNELPKYFSLPPCEEICRSQLP